MVSGFLDVSKIVILFNCNAVHPVYSGLLCRHAISSRSLGRPGLFAAAAVVVGVFAGSVNCGGTASPTRKNGGGIAGEV